MKLTKLFSLLFFGSLFLIAGILIGSNLDDSLKQANGEYSFSELRSGGYKFINPLYECAPSEIFGSAEYKDTQRKIENYLNREKTNGDIQDVSVYFRDLNNGPWFGIYQDTKFSPSSLLKLPIMLAYFRKSESNPGILNKKIKYTEVIYPNIKQSILPNSQLKIGKEYEVDFLIKEMIEESDNEALGLLRNDITDAEISSVYKDLNLPDSSNTSDIMSVKEYSSLFRILFNASYLNKKYSEKALTVLSQTKFKSGIRKPIPDNIYVANKFGERQVRGSTIKQLHDCGIVYYPNHPYLLCIMTRGQNVDKAEEIIQKVSKIIFEEQETRYKKN